MYRSVVKRLLDIVLACIFLIPSAAIIAVVSLISIIIHRSFKVFFFQNRIGYNNKVFRIIKLKTMRDRFDSEGKPLPDENRITSFGKFLRKTSIDELPQFVNVLKGDMSIVGPRPFMVEVCKTYLTEQQMEARHKIKPGITGWAQIHGRASISYDERLKYDLFYVDNASFSLDLKILILTPMVVFE